jgi:hypothetical protein
MAIVQISKIIHRTGANTDLPQLDAGEIGFASDEQKVYIGNDPLLHPIPDGQTTTQVELLTEVSNIDFSKVTGSGNVVFNVTTLHTGQLIVANGNAVATPNSFINWKGNALGTGSNIKLQLGNVANISITGGSATQLLTTDGAGNLSWSNPTAGATLPSQSSNSGTYLTTNGTAASWKNVFTDTNFATTVRSNISVTDSGGDGSLSYSSTTGVVTYTGPSATEVRAHFSAGTGVTITTGQISIAQDVASTANPTFANVTSENLILNTLTAPTGSENPIVYTGSGKKLLNETDFNYNEVTNTLKVGKVIVGSTTDTANNVTITSLLKAPMTTKTGTSTGETGQICWDNDYIYVCKQDGEWKRAALSSF